MEAFFSQFLKLWHKISFLQKITVIGTLFCVSFFLFYLLIPGGSSNYTPLFKQILEPSDAVMVKTYLDQFSIPFKEEKDKGLLVPEEYVDRVRMELMEANLPKQSQRKGFELFDTNTWIKGDKELQVLEMRALKGQLERDLAAFENIKSVSVILDIPPARNFSSSPYSTKASVILTLMPKGRLTVGNLKAITHHLAGAVRGLKPHMIAISDTMGKLYKEIQEEPKENLFNEEILLEDEIKEKIDVLLKMISGNEDFFSTIKILNEGALMVTVILDEALLSERKWEKENLKNELTLHIQTIASCFNKKVSPLIGFSRFDTKVSLPSKKEKKSLSYLLLLFLAACLVSSFFIFFKKTKSKKEEKGVFETKTKVNLNHLAESVMHESPKTIAMMLSYLEPERAEKMIRAFPEKIQEAIFQELERGDE